MFDGSTLSATCCAQTQNLTVILQNNFYIETPGYSPWIKNQLFDYKSKLEQFSWQEVLELGNWKQIDQTF